MATLFNPRKGICNIGRGGGEFHIKETAAEIPTGKENPWHPTQVWKNKQLVEYC
jgi:hypothetical protein